MDTKEQIKIRIVKGVNFFNAYRNRYDSTIFKLYWPKFVDLIEQYFDLQRTTEEKPTSVKLAEEVFGKEGQQ